MIPKYNCGDTVYIPQKAVIYSIHAGKFGISYGFRNKETKCVKYIKERNVYATPEEAKLAIKAILNNSLV